MGKESMWIILLQCMLLVECYIADLGVASVMESEKAEASSTTASRMSPPEGNTTFLSGPTTWCIALPSGVPQSDLQSALDWTCGLGMADCRPIREGGPCYLPDTLVSHASFAFNTYYQQNGNSDIACNFGGTATLTKTNPSYGKCVYLASSESSSSVAVAAAATPLLSTHKLDMLVTWKWNPLQLGVLSLILVFI